MADIRQNADVFGGLTVAGGGALYPFSIYGDSSGNGSSPYLQLQVIDQTSGGLLRINNQSGQLVFEVATDGVEIGSAYTLPFSAPAVNQILTRATGAGPGILSRRRYDGPIVTQTLPEFAGHDARVMLARFPRKVASTCPASSSPTARYTQHPWTPRSGASRPRVSASPSTVGPDPGA